MRRRPSTASADSSAAGAPEAGSRAQVYLHAGQLVVAAQPTAITTVLGSCVAVCLYDPKMRVGGVNHFLLPHHVERERSARFGNVAVPALVDEVLRAGASRSAIVAKVFGGASVLGTAGRRSRNLGEENAILALRLLADLRIPILDADLGGARGRKLVFFTDEGSAWVRQL